MHLEVVAVKPICQRQWHSGGQESVGQRLAPTNHLSLYQVDVEVAVVVVVEQRHAGTHHFLEVIPARHAVEVHEIEADGLCAVGEPFLSGGTRASRHPGRCVHAFLSLRGCGRLSRQAAVHTQQHDDGSGAGNAGRSIEPGLTVAR